jgi:hypothetical protein
MINSKWDLKHFKKDSKIDKWGDPSKMDAFLLMFLDDFREALGTPLIVTSGYRKGDAAQHGLGKAVDVVAPKWEGSLFDLYLMSERFGFSGIGLYRDWFYEGKKIGGLHLDTRMIIGSNLTECVAARWFCVRPGADKLTDIGEIMKIKQVYCKLDLDNLKREGVV